MLDFLRYNPKYKISFLEKHVSPYRLLSALYCATGSTNKALNVVELGRARALADIMLAQYSVQTEISVHPRTWVDLQKIMNKKSNCICLFISYYERYIFSWILKPSKEILSRQVDANDCFSNIEPERYVDGIMTEEALRNFHILSQEPCEDRSLFSSSANYMTPESSDKNCVTVPRLVEDDEEENQMPGPPTLAQWYQMIIAPVADELEEPEIIIVPDRIFYKVPFAALKDENEKYLSETLRIRIVPSLTTLKLIEDSPADYHSQTGALIVGEPAVSRVYYKGSVEKLCPLPCARKEAEMIGGLLGSQPLLGEHATKQAVLQSIHSVSLIHFAAHGNAERGEICPCPSTLH